MFKAWLFFFFHCCGFILPSPPADLVLCCYWQGREQFQKSRRTQRQSWDPWNKPESEKKPHMDISYNPNCRCTFGAVGVQNSSRTGTVHLLLLLQTLHKRTQYGLLAVNQTPLIQPVVVYLLYRHQLVTSRLSRSQERVKIRTKTLSRPSQGHVNTKRKSRPCQDQGQVKTKNKTLSRPGPSQDQERSGPSQDQEQDSVKPKTKTYH